MNAFRLLLPLGCAAGLALAACDSRETTLALPPFERATLIVHEGDGDHRAEIPPDQNRKLRAAFRGARRDPQPAKWPHYGEIRLHERGQVVLSIRLFQTPRGIGPFRTAGNDYRGYDEAAIRELVRTWGSVSPSSTRVVPAVRGEVIFPDPPPDTSTLQRMSGTFPPDTTTPLRVSGSFTLDARSPAK